jgi:hypothetical protein
MNNHNLLIGNPFLMALLSLLLLKLLVKVSETSEVSTASRLFQYFRKLVLSLVDLTGIDTLRICCKMLEHGLVLLLLETTIQAGQILHV